MGQEGRDRTRGGQEGKAGPPAARLFGWLSPHRHHSLGCDSLGGSLEEGEVGAGEKEGG